MPQLETIKAWIEVDKVALEEFQVKVDREKRTVHCYVPSEAGKAFTVAWSWEHRSATRCHISIDGRKAQGSVVGKDSRRRCGINNIILPGNRNLTAELKFGDISTTDDESISLQDEHLVKALGSIELDISLGSSVPTTSARQVHAKGSTSGVVVPQQQPIYERMKKAASHQVVLGEVKPTMWATYHFVPDGDEPVRFVFIYRSRDILLAQGIIPPPSAPVINENVDRIGPKEEEEEAERVDDEEDERLLHALKEQKAAIQKQEAAIQQQEEAIKQRRKRKSDGSERGVLKRLKVEEIEARAAFRPGEIIDLCDD